MKIKVGVIFGGESVEHEVSIISAVQAMNKMDTEKYEIIPIYITKDRIWYTGGMLKEIEVYQDISLLKRYAKEVVLYEKGGRFILQSKGFFKRQIAEIDIAFPIVHGTNVEDGVLQGYLQSIGIPFVGGDVYSSVVGQDKLFMKQIFESEKLPISAYTWFYDVEYNDDKDKVIEKIEGKLKYPVIVKPATLGSSVGIHSAKNKDELIEAIEDACNYDTKIVVEEMVQNLKEVNISVLGNYESQKLSAIEQVMSNEDFLTYEEKYIGNRKTKGVKGVKGVKGIKNSPSKGMASASRIVPAPLEKQQQDSIEQIATKAFKALGSSGVCRIDFLIDSKTNKVYINEINSIPGSLAFYLWEPIGKKYTELLDDMINIGIKDYKRRVAKVHSFDSNILKGFTEMTGVKGVKGCKK